MYAHAGGMRCNVVSDQGAQATKNLYNSALARGRWGMLWAKLTGRSRVLHSLEKVLHVCTVLSRSCSGRRMVAIAQIDGSESRAADFDRNFNPLQDRTRDRWLNIAKARQRGRYLPPVMLIQVGEHYFVRDGHHRISVARALGLDSIEATIEVWTVDKPLTKSSEFSLTRFGSITAGV